MNVGDEYARRWAKKEDVEADTLSEWIKSIAHAPKRRIRRLKHSVNTRHESIFSDPGVVRELSRLHENFVIVPADKASNNYTFVCKRHYVSILTEELGLNSLPGNPTYNLTDVSASEVLDNHKSVLTQWQQWSSVQWQQWSSAKWQHTQWQQWTSAKWQYPEWQQ